jgi:hypothetical protein
MDDLMDGYINRTDESMDGCMDEWMDRWIIDKYLFE